MSWFPIVNAGSGVNALADNSNPPPPKAGSFLAGLFGHDTFVGWDGECQLSRQPHSAHADALKKLLDAAAGIDEMMQDEATFSLDHSNFNLWDPLEKEGAMLEVRNMRNAKRLFDIAYAKKQVTQSEHYSPQGKKDLLDGLDAGFYAIREDMATALEQTAALDKKMYYGGYASSVAHSDAGTERTAALKGRGGLCRRCGKDSAGCDGACSYAPEFVDWGFTGSGCENTGNGWDYAGPKAVSLDDGEPHGIYDEDSETEDEATEEGQTEDDDANENDVANEDDEANEDNEVAEDDKASEDDVGQVQDGQTGEEEGFENRKTGEGAANDGEIDGCAVGERDAKEDWVEEGYYSNPKDEAEFDGGWQDEDEFDELWEHEDGGDYCW